jgi:hypothetical protein
MIDALDQTGDTRGPMFLNCPRCRLSIRVRARWLAMEHCPRCLGRDQILISLFSSPLPTTELYPEGSAPDPADRPPAVRRSG